VFARLLPLSTMESNKVARLDDHESQRYVVPARTWSAETGRCAAVCRLCRVSRWTKRLTLTSWELCTRAGSHSGASYNQALDDSFRCFALCRSDLADFRIEKVLNESAVSKMIVLLGTFEGKEGQAIVILARRHFVVDPNACTTMLASSALKQTFSNDIYAKFEGLLPSADTAINIDIIHPCTARHISKYSAQKTFIIVETPKLYEAVTRPHMDSIAPAAMQWVYNVLEKKKEADRLLYEDPDPDIGFMLHPDLKWDQSQVCSPTRCLQFCRHNIDKHVGMVWSGCVRLRFR
jgi:hypothetical protein